MAINAIQEVHIDAIFTNFIGDCEMTSIEMRSLILEALALEDSSATPSGYTFMQHGYRGSITDLRPIVEKLAIHHGLITEVVKINRTAWGLSGEKLYYGNNTSFPEDDIDLFTEELYFLISQNVISPGARGNYGEDLPYFHVTKYGLECLKSRDILPHDPDNYLDKIKSINSVDEWEMFYIEQGLRCYNAGALESSIIMLGLAGEYLAERLIDTACSFLNKNDPSIYNSLTNRLNSKTKISQKYEEYEKALKEVISVKTNTGEPKYPDLNSIQPRLDNPAKAIYATFLRLTRNELAHPTETKMDRIECLTMFISFIKYCETQHKYLDFFSQH